MQLNLKPHCVENLTKLRDFLWANREVVKVQMHTYSEVPLNKYELPVEQLAECGTVGCAIGWAPKVVPVPERYIKEDSVCFGLYAYEQFCEVEENSDYTDGRVFAALFDYRWAENGNDNTTEGVVYRIDTLLSEKRIPKEFLTDISQFDDSADDDPEAIEAYADMQTYHERRAEWLQQQGVSA